MARFFEIASGISTMWSLAAFAIAAVVYIAVRRGGRGKVPASAWTAVLAVVLLGLVPIAGSLYVESNKDRAIYRVRVTVLDPERSPVDDAHVWSSLGGEPKKVAGGWQFDIPTATKPADGKLTVYAKVEPSGLSGAADVNLAGDLNPAVMIPLQRIESAMVRGIVVDQAGNAIEGAMVSVVGYGSEQVATGPDGGFRLAAHTADGKTIRLHAQKDGYAAVDQDHRTGSVPATIILTARHP